MSDLVPAPDIALMGRARSGKDTIAARLVDRYGYVRVAFADPLREAALRLSPIVDFVNMGGGTHLPVTLNEIVAADGWERAKDEYPEVRRILQHMGQGVRDLNLDFWLDIALGRISELRHLGKPVVVTDLRYPNEYRALGSAGFRLVRVVRPGKACPGMPPWCKDDGSCDHSSEHDSERALDRYHADLDLYNSGSLDDLYKVVDYHASE